MDRDGTSYSFLDLAVLPEIGAAVADLRPAWLWHADGCRILWANAAGTEWFDAASVAKLTARSFPRRSHATREIARLAATLPAGASSLSVLPMRRGVTEQPLACDCRGVTLPDGSRALLVTAAAGETGDLRLVAAARHLLPTVAGEGGAVAVFDGEGGLLAHSRDYAALDPFAAEIDVLLERFVGHADRTLHGTVGEGDAARPARLARIASAVGDLLVLVVGTARPVVETMDDLENWRSAPARPEPLPDVPSVSRSSEPPTALAGDERSEPARMEATDAPAATPGTADMPVADPVASLHPAVPRPAPATPEAAGAPEAVETGPAEPSGPVRFAWEMDGAGRFTFVSPEFADAVGPRSADIVGWTWPDVAAGWQMDEDGAVARAMARQESWSGLTVAWPTDAGTRLPVDLAALPAFARDRRFAGYRGFGVCRRGEAPHDEPVAGADGASPPQPVAAEAPAAAPVPARGSNVVRLRGADPDPALRSEVLSGYERDAFRRIAEELGVPVAGATEAAVPRPGADVLAEAAAPVFEPQLLDRLPIGIVIFREKATLFVNRAALELFGYESQEAFAAAGGVEAVFPASDGDWSGEPGERLRARRSDRSEIAVEARLNRTRWGDDLALLLSISRPGAAADSAMPAVEVPASSPADQGRIAELEAILDTATDGVVLIDGLGFVLSLNRSAEALFGIEAGAVIGRPFVDLLAEESRKSALDYLDGLARNGVASLLNDGREVIGTVPSGGLIPLFMTIGRIGGSGKYCAVLRDITQWKNAEEELVSARRQAEVANNQKSEFLAKISHEIRTPLNAVIGFSEVMMEERFGPIGSDRYREYLRDIHLSGTHLMSLINDLLDLSKIEAGKLDLKFEQVAVNAVIQECVALMQPEANRERIIIRTSLSAGLPDIVVDRRSLRQIVLNLLSNAVKFTQPGGQVIVATTLEESGEVTIRVRDTGIGMTEKQIETALMPFRQVERADRKSVPGTGLGLPLTKALAEANRASFAIDSAVDQGTLVRITFPVTRVLAG